MPGGGARPLVRGKHPRRLDVPGQAQPKVVDRRQRQGWIRNDACAFLKSMGINFETKQSTA